MGVQEESVPMDSLKRQTAAEQEWKVKSKAEQSRKPLPISFDPVQAIRATAPALTGSNYQILQEISCSIYVIARNEVKDNVWMGDEAIS